MGYLRVQNNALTGTGIFISCPLLRLDSVNRSMVDGTRIKSHAASGAQSRNEAESPPVAEDYFTPEDSNTTILTVPKNNKRSVSVLRTHLHNARPDVHLTC